MEKVKAKKKFGQNFLIDEVVKEKIFLSIPTGLERIVEVGGGLGDLTKKLLQTDARVDCFEIDSELFVFLKEKFGREIANGQLTLTNADVLQIWHELSRTKYFLVANLPYYVATHIILRALKDEACDGFLVMVQKEVALKFCAKSGTREFCALSVLAEIFGGCELLFDVEAASFDPAPKVTSAVMKLTKKERPNLNYTAFCEFLKRAFCAPRKTLLKNLGLKTHSNISPLARPHEVSVSLYLELFKSI